MNWRGRAESLVRQSNLPAADRTVFRYFLTAADNGNGMVLPEHAWKLALSRIARATGLHVSTVARSLAHLESHHWIARYRSAGGRRRFTEYLILPHDPLDPDPCKCRKQSRDPVTRPLTDAERMRRYRARKRAGQAAKRNEPAGQAANVTANTTVNCRLSRNEPAGQAANLTERTQREKEVKRPLCFMCYERPTGPGGILCPQCKTAIEHRNRTLWNTA